MKTIFNPGTKKKTLTLVDNVVYSTVKDLNGDPLELKLSVLLQNGNSEMRAAMGEDDPKEDHSPKPALVWVPGGGWKGTDKNMMLGGNDRICKCRICGCFDLLPQQCPGALSGSADRCENGNPFSACSCSTVRDQSGEDRYLWPFRRCTSVSSCCHESGWF